MNTFYYLILVPLLTIVVPIGLSMWLYQRMKKKEIAKVWRMLAFLPVLLAIFLLLIPVKS